HTRFSRDWSSDVCSSDLVTGTVQFRAAFPNPNKLLSNGNSGIVLVPKEYNNVLVVPEVASFEQQGKVNVFKVVNDTVISTMVDRSEERRVGKEGRCRWWP